MQPQRNPHMVNIMQKMFDYNMEVSDVEKDLFSVQEKMELIINFIDLSCQLLDGPLDDNVAILLRKLTELGRYYDRRSTLNVHHCDNHY